jgi:uncharacterized HAD superfamily protein
MQLFLDIDGVVLNFQHSFVRWMNAQHGTRLPLDYQADHWDFTELLETDELERRWRAYLASPEAARMEPLLDPARFNALAAQHSVHLVTAFPLPYMDKRRENLAHLGLVYESLHHCGLLVYDNVVPKTKAQTIAELRRSHQPALFLDDHPDNCLDVAANCPDVEVWLMSWRFNRDFSHPAVRRAEGWPEVLRRLGREDLAAGLSAPKDG